MKKNDLEKLLEEAQVVSIKIKELTTQRKKYDETEQATIDVLSDIAKKIGNDELNKWMDNLCFVHEQSQVARWAERGFMAIGGAQGIPIGGAFISEATDATITDLRDSFISWRAREIDKHNLLATRVSDAMQAARSGMTEREAAWLAVRITEKRKTKEGDSLYPTQRDIALQLRMGVMTINRIEAEQEQRKEILALYRLLIIKPRVKRGVRVTTGKISGKG